MGKQYNSVSDLVKNVTEDKEFQREFDKEVSDKDLAKTLFAMRCAHGLTQAQMAKRLDCTQGTISKLENASLENISVASLEAYATALNLQLSIGFHKNFTAVEWVKYHAFQIKTHLDSLAKLAHKDDDIHKGVADFFVEAIVNFLGLVQKSAELLPAPRRCKAPAIRICSPTEGEEQHDPLETGVG